MKKTFYLFLLLLPLQLKTTEPSYYETLCGTLYYYLKNTTNYAAKLKKNSLQEILGKQHNIVITQPKKICPIPSTVSSVQNNLSDEETEAQGGLWIVIKKKNN